MKKILALILAILIIVLIFFFTRDNELIEEDFENEAPTTSQQKQDKEVQKSFSISDEIKKAEQQEKVSHTKSSAPSKAIEEFKPQNEVEKSFSKIHSLAKTMFLETKNIDSFKEELQNLGKDTKQQTSEDGDIHIIRLESPFPGTKHFHGRFFQKLDGTSYLQKVTFEVSPKETNLKRIVKSLRHQFQVTDELEKFSDGSYQLPYGEDYVIQLKELTEDDVNSINPFHTYTKDDIGLFQVVIKQKVF